VSARKTPILLRRSPLSNRVMALHRYTRKMIRGHEMIDTGMDGKQDVTGDFETLALMWLMDDGAEDIVGILDGVADGQLLTADEKAQVRVVRERIRAACERHNARLQAIEDGGEDV
jgi:hypothetical protein